MTSGWPSGLEQRQDCTLDLSCSVMRPALGCRVSTTLGTESTDVKRPPPGHLQRVLARTDNPAECSLSLFLTYSSQYPYKVKKNRCEGLKCENADRSRRASYLMLHLWCTFLNAEHFARTTEFKAKCLPMRSLQPKLQRGSQTVSTWCSPLLLQQS